jgi:hypothetical protein
MNPGDSSKAPGQDRADKDLQELRKAWDSLEKAEPPELIDRAVLNAARRDLAGRRKGEIRWMGGFATAAVVVLALSITLLQDEKPPLPLPAEPDGLKLDQAEPGAPTAKLRKDPALNDVGEAEVQLRREKREQFKLEAVAEESASQAPAAASVADSAEMDLDEQGQPMAETPGPEAWVERLQRLRQAGNSERFQQELEAFLEIYPDYPLPPGWRKD